METKKARSKLNEQNCRHEYEMERRLENIGQQKTNSEQHEQSCE